MHPTHQSEPGSQKYNFKNSQWAVMSAVIRLLKLAIIVKYLKTDALWYVKCMPILPEDLNIGSDNLKRCLTICVFAYM